MDPQRLHDTMRRHAGEREDTALAWAVSHRGQVEIGAAGTASRDTIFRISSMTKPVTAVAALVLVEDGVVGLDDPVDPLLPELSDRQVLAKPDGPLDETVPATRPITVRDTLTFRLGWGMDFSAPWDAQPVLAAMGDLELGVGPPAPAGPPEPDEWMRRLGTLPLSYQPGERWLYHVGSEVIGVLVARASGQPLETFMRERIFEPLGMADTGFSVPAGKLPRFSTCYAGTGEVYDPPDGQWSRPPAFPSGGAGLVSTVDDYVAFASMLLRGGDGVLSRESVEVMTTDHLTAEQRATSSPDPSGDVGYGFGVGIQLVAAESGQSPGSYGWGGGLGSTWGNDPAADVAGVLLTNQAFGSPEPSAVVRDFWTGVYAG